MATIAFLPYFQMRTGRRLRLIAKQKSWFMRLINVFITIGNAFGLCSIDDFMTGYTTTIGRTVYAAQPWTLTMEPSPHVVHELTHVMQWGFLFFWRYIFSPKWRLIYEVQAHHTSMLCYPDKRTKVNCERAAKKLVGYGAKYADALRLLLDALKEERPSPASKTVYEVFQAWQETHVESSAG
jgi:hypothetical protein